MTLSLDPLLVLNLPSCHPEQFIISEIQDIISYYVIVFVTGL